MAHNQLLNWYGQNKRNLPWRDTRDPYIIWLSEVILQQTRVQQGLPYFEKFASKYPDVQKLALATNDEIMKMWQGLGYYSRARNMHAAAQMVHHEHNNIFPTDYKSLLRLKGIGTYTAAAVASFAYNEPVAVLDGNVYRVLSRLFAVGEAVGSTKGKHVFAALAGEFLDKKEPALHNQAMMELGSLVCRPRKPLCHECPLQGRCLAYAQGMQEAYPVKIKKAVVKKRYFHYFYFNVKQETCIYRRPAGDIWQNLYDLPMIETGEELSLSGMVECFNNLNWFKPLHAGQFKDVMKTQHVLTHQRIFATFWAVELNSKPRPGHDYFWVKPAQLKNYAVHRLFDKFLQARNLVS